tara:strand:+ start:1464 stop:4319 length:2856 start_codon:yes stop_codon:yes gene_type:complete
MLYIKKLVIQGFKSFPRKTELLFNSDINIILGSNGSGKSNISDALCFVLGRLSIKSIRAAKAKNLIFQGTKSVSPSKEAMVEIVFDNSDESFSLDTNEVSIKRIVRKNGQSIYKINNQTKTRQEVLFLLAQVDIDSNGFNIILQGEINNFVRMRSEERRKVIEEVSGISVYELRKEKSLKELSKTGDRLKEVETILRERTSYLNNLEKQRQQALRYKKLEIDVKRYKASIIHFDLTKKKKEEERINIEISKKNKEIEKIKKLMDSLKTNIENYELKINSINSLIQTSTGLEQEKLNQEIANLRAELAGMNVKIENYENKISEISSQKKEIQDSINEHENSTKKLRKEPVLERKQKDIELKKKELENLEEQRKKFYMFKSELKSIKNLIDDKNSTLKNYLNESDFLLKQIEQISSELFDQDSDEKKLNLLRASIKERKQFVEELNKKQIKLEKISYTNSYEIEKQEKLKNKISKIDVCPVCKSKVTEKHAKIVNDGAEEEIKSLKKEITNSNNELTEIKNKKDKLNNEIEEINQEILERESDLMKLSNINGKKDQIRILQDKIDKLKKEFSDLEKTRKRIEKNLHENLNIEQKYETARFDFQEISLRSKENVDSEIFFKQKELERLKISLKQFQREEEDLNEDLEINRKELETKEEILEEKKQEEEKLTKKFRKLISEREEFQKKIRDCESQIYKNQNLNHNIEQEVNQFNIDNARVKAEIQNFETDMLEFSNIEIIKTNRDSLVQKFERTKEIISNIGSVNLLALEEYDSVKKEYDSIKEKVEIIEKEKNDILKIIHEIDVKKKKTFLQTLNSLNEIFSRNFSSLSAKGSVSLELENRKDPFEGGINIIIKTGHGKYFDAASLSGGEQVLVALSLIFAIQELNPYSFYIFDEIDAALDKKNSERLAGLLKKYIQKGQYIIITHNDEIISNASNLYGVSMHEGVSKIVSLKV